MSKQRARKYYKKCIYRYGYIFAPTGAFQPCERMSFKRKLKEQR